MRHRLSRHALLLSAAAATFGLAACGDTTHNRFASNEGIYVDLGKLKYQVELSRELNTYSAEDAAYVQGLPPATLALGPKNAWFAVSMLVVNKTGQSRPAASTYYITDTQGTVFRPTPSPPGNPFDYRPLTIGPHAQLPVQGSPAALSPTNGAILLFRVPLASFDNRPLMLHIADPTDAAQRAIVQLDV